MTDPADGRGTPGSPLIQMEGIGKTYEVGQEMVYALREIHLQIGVGEYLAIMDPQVRGNRPS